MADITRGDNLWTEVTEAHDLDPVQLVILQEACRCADRLDALDARIGAGDDAALSEARQQQNVMKQLLVSLRLPDAATGKKPTLRAARGAYSKRPSGKVSSLDRARAAKSS
jgi:hypothetical protein